jgi:hypothetical protein
MLLKLNIKKIITIFTPPIFFVVKNKLIKPKINNKLFDGQNSLFKKVLSSNSVYGEYGCGASTIYACQKFNIPIISVDSSKFWVDQLKKYIKNKKIIKKNLKIKYVNIGNTTQSKLGKPDDFSKSYNFKKYAHIIWKQQFKPNVVLIDGRLRVFCFFISLKLCQENTKIIFDDYNERKYYHIVEEVIKPVQTDGRQALFIVNKKKINTKKLNLYINKFEYVLD